MCSSLMRCRWCLNESPSEKEGKCQADLRRTSAIGRASMKVYTPRCRTNGPAVILIHHNSLSYWKSHKLLGIVFSDFGANVLVKPQ